MTLRNRRDTHDHLTQTTKYMKGERLRSKDNNSMFTVHFNLVVVVADKGEQYTDSKVLRLRH